MTSVPTLAMVATCPAVNVVGLPATVKLVTVTGPSGLVVPVSTEPDSGVSSFVLTISSASLNGSSTGETVMVSVEVSPLEPSVIV
nr:hypothetical protein [Variovorax sp. KK3]